VCELPEILKQKQIGVVTHFYMNTELQGIPLVDQKLWPHIHILNSLVMAITMTNVGCKYIAILGVDFMSENVCAILDHVGHRQVSHIFPKVLWLLLEGCSSLLHFAYKTLLNYLFSHP
jgi:quinolinate synthase